MRPYYVDECVTIYLGDCREVLPLLDDVAGAAATIADPPYSETSLPWDRWPAGWVAAVDDATPLAAPLWCFGSVRMFLARSGEFDRWRLAQDVVWEKHNGSSSAADRFRRVHELALQWYRGSWSDVYREPVTTDDAVARRMHRRQRPTQWGEIGDAAYESVDGGPRLMRSVIPVRSENGRAEHPTQKPVGIVDPLVRYSCPPGGLVLDPFAGSGTTLVAAKTTGRRAVGIEADERYCEVAAQRVQRSLALDQPQEATP